MDDCFDDGSGHLVFVAVAFVLIGILVNRDRYRAQ